MSSISSKTTVAQCDLGRILSIGKVVPGLFFTGFGFVTIRVNLKQNDSCAECFDANFMQQDSCARCFGQVLGFQEMSAILKQNDSCAVLFGANFEQQESCARRFLQVLAS